MVQAQHLGGNSLVTVLRKHGFQCVIDMGGGVGVLAANLLRNMPGLRQAVVVDVPDVLAVAQKVKALTVQPALPWTLWP